MLAATKAFLLQDYGFSHNILASLNVIKQIMDLGRHERGLDGLMYVLSQYLPQTRIERQGEQGNICKVVPTLLIPVPLIWLLCYIFV
jgi:hypothetical protein